MGCRVFRSKYICHVRFTQKVTDLSVHVSFRGFTRKMLGTMFLIILLP